MKQEPFLPFLLFMIQDRFSSALFLMNKEPFLPALLFTMKSQNDMSANAAELISQLKHPSFHVQQVLFFFEPFSFFRTRALSLSTGSTTGNFMSPSGLPYPDEGDISSPS